MLYKLLSRALMSMLGTGIVFAMTTLLIVPSAHAEYAALKKQTVTSVWAGPYDFVRVYLAGKPIPNTACSVRNGFAVLKSDRNFAEIYAALLIAVSTNKTVGVWITDIDDCVHGDTFPIATRVSLER